MEIGYTEEQQALQRELRTYYAELLTPEVEEQLAAGGGIGPDMRRVVKQMADDGWLGIGWPKEYGGQGRSALEQFIFFDESMRAGAPVPMLTINTVGPTIMDFGTPEQKADFLPRILAGDIHFCIGYTEPNAGTDLAALETRAVRDGDEYVINGQKIYTSLAGGADYIWLATRTDPEGLQAQGDLDVHRPHGHPRDQRGPHAPARRPQHQLHLLRGRPGPRRQPGGWREQRLDPHHQPAQSRAGHLVLSGHHRAGPGRHPAWAQATKLADGRRVIDQEWVQVHLARIHAKLEFLKLINWKVAWTATQGHLDVADASTIKVFGTEFYMEAFRLMMEVVGQAGYLTRGTPEAVLAGRLEMYARSLVILTFGGGTNEIQRDLIAIFGLGLPRSLR